MQVKAKFSKGMLNNKEHSQYEQIPGKDLKSTIKEHDIIDLMGLGHFRGEKTGNMNDGSEGRIF
jgi:hypothetical protein